MALTQVFVDLQGKEKVVLSGCYRRGRFQVARGLRFRPGNRPLQRTAEAVEQPRFCDQRTLFDRNEGRVRHGGEGVDAHPRSRVRVPRR